MYPAIDLHPCGAFRLLAPILLSISACSSDEPSSNDGGGTVSTTTATTGAPSDTTTGSTETATSTSAATNTAGGQTTAGTIGSTSTAGGTSTTGAAAAGSVSTTTTGTGAGGATAMGMGGTSSVSGGGATGAGGTGMEVAFTLTSPAFSDDGTCAPDAKANCDMFQTENSYFQDNESPELNWTTGPAGTLSYAIVFDDLEAQAHWAIWNIPAETQSLPAALPGDAMLSNPPGAQQVNASWVMGVGEGYGGPGSCDNVYEFKIYALDVAMFTPANASGPGAIRDELNASSSVLATATLRAQANPADGNNC